MAPGDAPLERSWIAAVHASADDFSPLGAGLVIDESRVLTCAHLLSGENEDLWVAFPNAQPPTMERRRIRRRVFASRSSVADAAVLYLDAPVPSGVRPPRLRCPRPESLRGERWWAFGFAEDDVFGNSADGEVGESLGYGWVRLDSESRYLVQRGFSGGGLWSPRYEAVVGLVGQANDRGDGRALTFDWLDGHFPSEGIRSLTEWSAADAGEMALTSWGWQLAGDPEARRHWSPRARGVAVDSERGFRFRGRRRALEEIAAWLDRPRPDHRVLVVTGSPGVGKSAVLGRIVTTADLGFRSLLPAYDDACRATPGSVGCAVHAKGKTALEIAAEIAKAVSAEVPVQLEDEAPFVRAALEERRAARFNVVVDALDEAQTPAEARLVVEKVVRPLVETCADVGVQVVVGSRRYDGAGDLLGALEAAAVTIDLDRPEYFALEDLTAYALASLQLVGAEREDSPYVDVAVARPVAQRIAEMADRNFLIAGLVARDHGLHDTRAVRPADVAFTTSVESALGRYMERVPPLGPIPHVVALGALAFAEPPGFTSTLWAIVIEALSGIAPTDKDVIAFARSSAANFLVEQSEGPDGSVFRLFHQALNEALLSHRRRAYSRSGDEAAITRALLAHGWSVGWGAAPNYLLRSLPVHAVRAGLIDELLADDDYLFHADVLRLLPAAHWATTSQARRRTRLLTLTPEVVETDPPSRAALLSLTNVLDGLDTGIGSVPHQLYRGRWAATKRRTEVATLEGHTGWVFSVCALKVGGRTLLASGDGEGTVRLWDPASCELVATLDGHVDRVVSLCALEAGGRTLLASCDGSRVVRLWELTRYRAMAIQKDRTDLVLSLCALKAGGRTLLASGGYGRTLRLWDPVSGEAVITLEGHVGGVLSLCTLQFGGRTLLVSGDGEGTVRLWNPLSGKTFATLRGHTGEILSLCAVRVAGHAFLASGGRDRTVRLWDPRGGGALVVMEGHTGEVLSLCTLEVGGSTLLASASDDRTMRLWDVSNGDTVATLRGHTGGLFSICALEVGGRTLLASGGRDRTVRLWDPNGSDAVEEQEDLSGGEVPSLCALEIKGKSLLASGGGEGTMRLWDSLSGEVVTRPKNHSSWIQSLCALEVEGRTLLASAGDDGTMRLWDVSTGETMASLEGRTGSFFSLCAVEVGGRTLLASGGYDRVIRLWDPATGEVLAALEGHRGWVFSVCTLEVEGQTLLASGGGDRTVRLWNPVSGEVVAILKGHTGGISSLCSLKADGRTLLASAGDDCTVRLWDPIGDRTVTTLEGHTGWVLSVCALEVGGRTLLASGGDDRTVRFWDPLSGRIEAVLPVRHVVKSMTAVAGGLAVGLTSGILVLDVPAPTPLLRFGEEPHWRVEDGLDFLISYAEADRAWAEWIAWELEQTGSRVVLQPWDFRSGRNPVAERGRAFDRAKQVLAVLSPAYVASTLDKGDWRRALVGEEPARRLLLVRVVDFRPLGLFPTSAYVDLVGLNERAARAALSAGVHYGRVRPRQASPPYPVRFSASAPVFPAARAGM